MNSPQQQKKKGEAHILDPLGEMKQLGGSDRDAVAADEAAVAKKRKKGSKVKNP